VSNRVIAAYEYNPTMQVFIAALQFVVLIPMGLLIVYWGGFSGVDGLAYLGYGLVVLGVLLGWLGFAQNASYKKNQLQVSDNTVRTVFKGQSNVFQLDEIAEIVAPGNGKQTLIVKLRRGGKMIFNTPRNGHEVADAFFAAKMEKIRATMTPAEWENYKLQLENNRLLQKLNKRGGSNSSGYSMSYTQEID
jgi:hypothetical protein